MKKILLVFMMFLSVIIAACGNEGDSEEVSENGETEADDETLVIGTGNDVVSFDIHDHNNTSTEAIHVNMFNYLVKNEGDGEFVPDLAESWENIDDTTWSFTLKEGVKFHNGDELTSEDVKFSLERAANDDSLLENGAYRQIEEVEVINDYEFLIHTYEPEPILLNRLSRIGSGILPHNYIEEEGWETFLTDPIGTGPYKLSEWQQDSHITLEKNDEYFDGETEWEEVIFRVIPEDSTRVSELLTGGVDLAVNMPPDDIDRIENEDNLSISSAPSQRVMMFTLRTEGDYPTADPKVREAIDLAIDKEAIIDSLLGGYGTPTRTRVTPGNTGANEDLYDTQVYDPEKAKELLSEAGYEDGLSITITAPNGRYLKDAESVELMAAMLQEVGIETNLEMLEYSAFSTKYADKSMDEMFFIGYGNSMFDASQALQRLEKEQAEGESDYDNPEVEELLRSAMTNMDREERIQQYQEAQEIVAEERPQIYLYQVDSIYGVNDRIDFNPRLDEMLYVDEITLK